MTSRLIEEIQITEKKIHQQLPKTHHKEEEINLRISITFFSLSTFPVNNGQSTGTKFHLLFFFGGDLCLLYFMNSLGGKWEICDLRITKKKKCQM